MRGGPLGQVRGPDPEHRALVALSLSSTTRWSPADVLRLLRQHGSQDVAGTYRRLLDGGLVRVAPTPFGPRLCLTAEAFRAAEQRLRELRPCGTPVAADETPAPRPTLLHDLLTLAGLLVRDGGRLTGDGLLNAQSLRRLEGLCLTQAEAVPRVVRRTPPGTEVWQFLLRFLDAAGWVRVSAGQARLEEALLDDLAAAPSLLPVALALFTFAAARFPTQATGWFGVLGPDVPVRYPLRALSTWLAESGVTTADAESAGWFHRGLLLLEATGLAVLDHSSVVLLPEAAQLWAPDPRAWVAPPTTSSGGCDAELAQPIRLPDGRKAVDLIAAGAALRTRARWERTVGPVEVGQVLLYPDAQTQDTVGMAEIGIAAVCRVEDPKMAEALAERMGTAVLARWESGIAVAPYWLTALERAAEAIGLRVRRCLWTGDGSTRQEAFVAEDGAETMDPWQRITVPEPALPWTLSRARQGVWRSTDDDSAALPPDLEDSVPPTPTPGAPPGAYLLWAAHTGRLTTITPVGGGLPTVVLPLALRPGPSGETVEVLDPEVPDRLVTIALQEIGDVRPYGASQAGAASLTPAKARE